MSNNLPPELRRELMKAVLLDGACVLGGVGLFLVTGSCIWLVAGILLGAGFILPALIAIMKARK